MLHPDDTPAHAPDRPLFDNTSPPSAHAPSGPNAPPAHPAAAAAPQLEAAQHSCKARVTNVTKPVVTRPNRVSQPRFLSPKRGSNGFHFSKNTGKNRCELGSFGKKSPPAGASTPAAHPVDSYRGFWPQMRDSRPKTLLIRAQSARFTTPMWTIYSRFTPTNSQSSPAVPARERPSHGGPPT
jgi:hypothetical protein